MNRNRKRLICGLGVAALATGTLLALPSTESAGAAALSAAPTVTHSAGSYVSKFADGETVVSLTPVQRVTATRGAADAGSSFTPTGSASKTGATPALAALSSVSAVPSSVDMLKALGAPASVLSKFANFDDTTASSPAVLKASALSLGTSQANATTTSTTWHGKSLYNRTCDGNSTLDGGHLSTYGCWNQYVVYKNGAHWQFLDQFYMSGTHNGGSNGITGLLQGESYDTNNHWTDWNPRHSSSGGNCSQTTVSLNVTAAFGGAGVSTTYTQCPETYGLHYIRGDVYPIQYQTKWDGNPNGPSNGSRDTGGTVWDDSPSNASAVRGWTWHTWWE